MNRYPVLFIILFLLPLFMAAQESFRKYPIGESGCSAYFPVDPGQADLSFSPDSSRVYTLECSDSEGRTFSIIVIGLSLDLGSDDIEPMLTSYLDYLQEQFQVTGAAGYGTGHSLSTHPGSRGVIDYWSTEEDDIEVAAYGINNTLAVMMVFSGKGKETGTLGQVFFNGFRFPGD